MEHEIQLTRNMENSKELGCKNTGVNMRVKKMSDI